MKLVRSGLSWVYVLLIFGFILMPVVSLVVFSFQATNLPVPPFTGPSLRWYEALFADSRMIEALRNSIVVGVVSGFFSRFSCRIRARPLSTPRSTCNQSNRDDPLGGVLPRDWVRPLGDRK